MASNQPQPFGSFASQAPLEQQSQWELVQPRHLQQQTVTLPFVAATQQHAISQAPTTLAGLIAQQFRPQQQQQRQQRQVQAPLHDSAASVQGQRPVAALLRPHHATPAQHRLLRLVVADALASLRPDDRHLLLDLLHANPAFALLFSYSQAGDTDAAQTVSVALATDEHQEILSRLMAQVQDQPGAQTLPSAAETEHPLMLDAVAVKDQAVPEGSNSGAESKAAAISIALIPEFDKYTSSESATARVVVSLRAAAQEEQRQSNIAVTSVLDVSGSMSGRRLELLQETSHFLVQQVTDNDFLGFVSYSQAPTVDVPLVRMTKTAKLFAHTVLDSLRAAGGTALYDGALAGMAQQLETLADDNKVAKALFLCTDGEANIGPADSDTILPGLCQVQSSSGETCAIHTFGIGDGHSAQLLQAISESLSGMYYNIQSVSDVAPAYADCLGGLLSVMAKHVRISVNVPAAAAGVSLSGIDAGGVVSDHTVTFNDIYSEETRELLLRFQLPAIGAGGVSSAAGAAADPEQLHVADVTMVYVDALTGKEVSSRLPVVISRSFLAGDAAAAQVAHPLVLATAARFETANVIKRAQALGQAGRVAEAMQMLQNCALQRSQESAAPSMSAEAAQQLNMLSAQTQQVAALVQQAASNCRDSAASKQAVSTISAAYQGLQVQRTVNVGATSSMPSCSDNQARASMRARSIGIAASLRGERQ